MLYQETLRSTPDARTAARLKLKIPRCFLIEFVRMPRILLLMALWTGSASLAGAVRDGRSSERGDMDFQSLNQDATTTTSGDAWEICCACPGGEITYPPGSICPPTCTQRPEQGGCTVSETRKRVAPPLPPRSYVDVPKWICCVCPLEDKELTWPATSPCPEKCKKKGEGTRPGQEGYNQGDQICTV